MLYPSLYEGWGLPIVEALQHRRPVIASNRGAVPEASMGVAQMLDPNDLDAWCDAVRLVGHSPRIETPSILPPTWDDAAANIRSIILRQAAVCAEVRT
jgi:glycosyltransferase involved in cell wall biosynthesis